MNSINKISNKVNNINKSKKIFKRNKSSKNNLFNKLALYNPYTKEENLFNNKSHKEILLSFIKKAQMALLLDIKSNNCITKKEKIKYFKKLISDLKQNLIYMLIEKKTKEKFLMKKINKIKKSLQDKIYNSKQEKENNKDIKYEDLIKETEVLEKSYGGNELSKLKMINFVAENEIQKLDFLIQNKSYINYYIKTTNIYPEERVELFCNHQKEDTKEIDQSYNSLLNKAKEELNFLTKEKIKQDKEIEEIKNEINQIKSKIEFEQIKPDDIIFEVSQENKSINNISHLYNDYFENSIIFSKDYNNYLNDKILENNKIKSEERNNHKKKFKISKNNFENVLNLNMNINFNIKINKFISKLINKSKIKKKNKKKNNNNTQDNNDFLKLKKTKKKKHNDNENRIKIPQNLVIKRKLSDNVIIAH